MNRIEYFGTTSYLELTDAELYGGVKFQYDLFEGEQIELGSTPSASIKFRCDRQFPIGKSLLYYHNENFINGFIVTDCKRDTATELYDITAYDRMIEFNMDVSEWSQNLTFPITLQSLFTSLFHYVRGEWTLLTWNGLNGDYEITTKTWNDSNLTGRLMLKYIAQMAGGYANYSGINRLTFPTYGTTVNLTNNAWKTRTIAEYTCPVIDKVWVGAEDGDIGYSSGTGNNALKIIDNPLFYGDNAQAIQTAVDNIYAEVHALPAYSPMEIELFDMPDTDNYKNNILKLVTFNTTKNGVTTTSIITNTYWDNSGAKYTSKGLANRDAVRNYVDNKTYETNAKYNKLTRDINQTVSEIATLDGRVTTIEQNADSVGVYVRAQAHVFEQDTDPTETQTVNKYDMWHDTSNDTYWRFDSAGTWIPIEESDFKNTEIINSMSQTLDGVVYESSLADGTTIINGGCITTGTINGNRVDASTINAGQLNLTGAITWNDFSSSAQSRIDSGKGDPNPSYIHSTYISQTEVRSPHIIGGLIEGDTLKVYNQYEACDSAGNTTGYIGSSGVGDNLGIYIESADTTNYLRVNDNYIALEATGDAQTGIRIRENVTNGPAMFLDGKIGMDSNYSYGPTLPTSGNFTGRLFFKI